MISFLVLPFLTCLALVLIHVYFGSFVLKRGVIFIDLALAQWAALGYLVANWLHIHDPLPLFLMAFGFTVLASAVLALLKPLFEQTNLQEAVIGVVYILGISVAVSLISVTGMEGHHLNELLAGHLLFVQESEIISAYALYAFIAACILFFHAKFNKPTRFWDFMFYVLFRAVVTSSVKLVGVLLVFAYLVLPLLSVWLFTERFKTRLIAAWAIGVVATVLGLVTSIWLDIPPSYAVILCLADIWLGSVILKSLLNKKNA